MVGSSVIDMSIVEDMAQRPISGVKVLVNIPVCELSIVLGFHVPVKPSKEVKGKSSILPVWQYGPIIAKVGVSGGPTDTTIVCSFEH